MRSSYLLAVLVVLTSCSSPRSSTGQTVDSVDAVGTRSDDARKLDALLPRPKRGFTLHATPERAPSLRDVVVQLEAATGVHFLVGDQAREQLSRTTSGLLSDIEVPPAAAWRVVETMLAQNGFVVRGHRTRHRHARFHAGERVAEVARDRDRRVGDRRVRRASGRHLQHRSRSRRARRAAVVDVAAPALSRSTDSEHPAADGIPAPARRNGRRSRERRADDPDCQYAASARDRGAAGAGTGVGRERATSLIRAATAMLESPQSRSPPTDSGRSQAC